MILIEQALQIAHQRQLELAAIEASPIANVGVAMMSIAGGKAKEEWFNPYSTKLYEQEAKRTCNPDSAKLFLKLAASGKLPSWAISHVNLELIQAAAK